MKQIIFFSFLVFIACRSFGQASQSDSLVVEYKKYELTEQDLPLMGKQNMIMGTIIIKKGAKVIASHDFLVPIIKGVISHIAVLDENGK